MLRPILAASAGAAVAIVSIAAAAKAVFRFFMVYPLGMMLAVTGGYGRRLRVTVTGYGDTLLNP
jgi:hypothetical protein